MCSQALAYAPGSTDGSRKLSVRRLTHLIDVFIGGVLVLEPLGVTMSFCASLAGSGSFVTLEVIPPAVTHDVTPPVVPAAIAHPVLVGHVTAEVTPPVVPASSDAIRRCYISLATLNAICAASSSPSWRSRATGVSAETVLYPIGILKSSSPKLFTL